MIERIFAAVVRKIEGTPDKVVLKEGKEGTGVTLPYQCGFCREGDKIVGGKLVPGVAKAAFRTQRERNMHTNRCPN
jgi:hypothetical protein